MIRPVTQHDAEEICRIYYYHVQNTIVTFEEQAVSADEMRQRIDQTTRDYPWLVLEQEGSVIGYAYADRWKSRCSFRYAVESTIYLAEGARHKGSGTRLYQSLIEELRACPVHCVVAAISLPNPESVALHEKLGFEKVAHFMQVGWKLNQWIDVGCWELMLDSDRQPPARTK